MSRDISKYADNALIADCLSDVAHNISGACTILSDRARNAGDTEKAEHLLDYADDVLDKMRNVPLKRDVLIETLDEFDTKYAELKAELNEDGE